MEETVFSLLSPIATNLRHCEPEPEEERKSLVSVGESSDPCQEYHRDISGIQFGARRKGSDTSKAPVMVGVGVGVVRGRDASLFA